MLELGKGCGNVTWHGYVDGTGEVVPFEGESTVEGPGPVSGDFVHVFDGIYEVLGVFDAFILNAKIVNNEGVGDRAVGVFPETWCNAAFDVAVRLRCLVSFLCASMPACGKPYIPLRISM